MGNKRGHKGGHRRFTNPQEVEYRKEKEEREKEWRRRRGEIEESEEDEESDEEEETESSEEEVKNLDDEEESEEESEPAIEIVNPNRAPPKVKKDVNALANEKVVLSRKDKEQIEKQRARENYGKLHSEGKTKQAREDLARLALIKQKREEAAKKREELAKCSEATSSKKSVVKK